MAMRHRVMVQLKDVALEDESEPTYAYDGYEWVVIPPSADYAQRSTISTDVEVFDNRTLQLSKASSIDVNARPRGLRQLQFDCVGAPTDIQTRAEYNSMLDLLLLKHYNCCLIQFTVQRECQISFLSNLLITELDQRVQKSHSCLHSIRVEFHDVRKFDVVNLFTKSAHTMRRPRNHFNNTLELLKWFNSDYAHMWAMGRGYSMLDVHLHYTDGRRHMHRTKFSLVQIHTIDMDNDMKTSLRNFFESHTSHKRLKHTNTIIDCMREYFSGPELWRTWMLFEVPTSNSIGSTTDDLLSIASAAYAGSLATNILQNTTVKEKPLSSDSDNAIADGIKTLVKPHGNAMTDGIKTLVKPHGNAMADGIKTLAKPHGNSSMLLRKTQSKDAAAEAAALKSKLHTAVPRSRNTRGMTVLSATIKEPKAQTKRVEDFSTKDLDSLSTWYAKVDEKFSQTIAALEKYYAEKYESRIGKISGEIQQIVRIGNNVDDPMQRQSCPFVPKTAASEDKLKELYKGYQDALASFRKLEKDVVSSQFHDQLQVYLKTKHYELTQHALQYKMRQLENCRAQLSDVIRKEMNALKTLKTKTESSQSIPRHVNIQLKAA